MTKMDDGPKAASDVYQEGALRRIAAAEEAYKQAKRAVKKLPHIKEADVLSWRL